MMIKWNNNAIRAYAWWLFGRWWRDCNNKIYCQKKRKREDLYKRYGSFLNDGLGSKSLTSDTSFNIFVTENIFNQTNGKLADFVQPESFNPNLKI